VTKPKAYNIWAEEMDRMRGEHQISKPFVGTLSNVHLFGSPPLVFYDRSNVKEATIKSTIRSLNVINSIYNLPYQLISNKNSENQIDEAVLLHHSWTSGYFHWIAETIVQLEGIEKYIIKTGHRPKLIVGPELNQFQSEILNLLGYGPEYLINWTNYYAKVDKLVIPSVRREINPGRPSPFPYHWIRDRLRKKCMCEINTDRFSDRVYISRNDAGERRVINEDEVHNTLKNYGFKKYTLSTMNVKEVVTLFAQAEIIIGPHGAGLTDIIYADNVSVIEFHPEDRLNGIYFMLTEQVDSWYGYLICQSMARRTNDMIVNVDELEKLLHSAITKENDGKI
jgi:capsular polysaccharide biosynthesis protein